MAACAFPIIAIACGLDVVGEASFFSDAGRADGPVVLPPVNDGQSPIDGGVDAPDGIAPFSCPSGRGPAMVLVRPAQGAPFCIDTTEVSLAQYSVMLDGGGITAPAAFSDAGAAVATACATNTNFAPKGVTAGPDRPVVNVSWCDAYAYCHWAGKNLCSGGPDVDGGLLEGDWGKACSASGTRTYPYGTAFESGRCNLNSSATAVGSLAGCVGGEPGIFDMSGNAGEWVDRCRIGPTGLRCATVGGSFISAPAAATCASTFEDLAPTTVYYAFGLRCCAPPR